MLILIGAYFLSLIPGILLLIWLAKQNPEEPEYSRSFKQAVKYGLLSPIPVVLSSALLALFKNLVFHGLPGMPGIAYTHFFLHAFTEELWKFLLAYMVLKKCAYKSSWRDFTVFAVVVALGFEFMESILYAFESNIIQMAVRGLTLMHAGFAYIAGKYYGKAKATGNVFNYVIAFLVPFLLHGLYDFTLQEEVLALNDNLVFVPVTIAMFAVVLLVRMILFFRKAQKEEIYTRAIFPAAEETSYESVKPE